MTSGTYENEKLPEDRELKDLILNNSQRICAQTNDLTPPCPPQSLIVSDEFSCENYFDNQSCEIREFENRIEWQVDGDICGEDTRFFNIYFSDDNKNFNKIGYSTNTFFIHKNLFMHRNNVCIISLCIILHLHKKDICIKRMHKICFMHKKFSKHIFYA